jgi:hypothetical protein
MKILISVLLASSIVQAQERDFPMAVNASSAGDTAAAAPASGIVTRSGKEIVTITIHNSCFGSNLRGAGNPLSPNSVVTANLAFVINGKDYPIKVSYPGDLVTKGGIKAPSVSPMQAGTFSGATSAGIYGNTVIMRTPIATEVSVDNSGNIKVAPNEQIHLKSYQFEQEVNCAGGPVYGAYGYSSHIPTYPCGQFMGKNGVVAASLGGLNVSSDKTAIDLYVSFPGQTGFCGGYWSPLMVFFDEARPKFDNISSFPLNPMGKTSWPEADHVGYFLALDRDASGAIDKKEELFGDGVFEKNGFEVLKKLDSNKDGVIDKKDKDFKNLVLWNDKNGDGISQKEELIKLSDKIDKISLKYEKGNLVPIGKFAEQRERSKFWYKENGKKKQGQIFDIWLAPAEDKAADQAADNTAKSK